MRIVPVDFRRTLKNVHVELGRVHALIAGADSAKEVQDDVLLKETRNIERLSETLRKAAASVRFQIQREPLPPDQALILGHPEGLRLEDSILSVQRQLGDVDIALDEITAKIARQVDPSDEIPNSEHRVRQLYEDYGRALERRDYLEKVERSLHARPEVEG
ncbi:MAG: hypothetical protein F4Y16_05785 [Holophagales bacterium]|nr:hypothetical protein [Holophagales bacterium]MYH27006.1 hypothetical protein [Holophagales bacterium]